MHNDSLAPLHGICTITLALGTEKQVLENGGTWKTCPPPALCFPMPQNMPIIMRKVSKLTFGFEEGLNHFRTLRMCEDCLGHPKQI